MGLEVILPIIVTVLLATIGGGYTLWKNAKSEAKEASKKLDERIKEMEDAQKEFLGKETLKQIMDRLDKMEESRANYVLRDEFAEGQRRMENVLERIGTSIAQSNSSMTSRMDAIMFELTKQGKARE